MVSVLDNQLNAAKILVKNVEMTYKTRKGKISALKDINLSVRPGEFLCLVGPSGCGKSTLLRIMCGLLQPTDGEIRINGAIMNRPGADRAMVFQEDSVFPWLTVEKNVEYGLKIRGIKEEERKKTTDHYLRLVGLNRKDIKQLLPKELSGGMRKRVDMARAFANGPDILFMDEPFGMLDAMTKERLQVETLHIWEETKKTICFVTHDLEEALFLADRIIMLEVDPGHIHNEIVPPFGRPRDVSLKTTPEFQELRRELLEVMNELASKGGHRADE